MTSNKQQKGVIDPISIIAGLFLVVTLIVGTVVVNDRGFSLNIAEKASTTGNSCFDECRKEKGRVYCNNLCGINVNWEGEVITAPVNPSAGVTCDANGKQYSAGSVVIYGGIGSYATCGSDGRWQVGVGSLTDVKPENVPQYALPAYQQAVNQAQQPNAEVNQQETTTLASDELRRDCEFSGGVWNNTNSSCFNPNLQEVVNEFHEIQDIRPLGEKRCSGTSYIETWNGTTWDRSRCEYGCLNNACIANNPNTIIKPDGITQFNQPNTAEGSTTPTEIVNETSQEITQSFLNSLLQQIPRWDNYQGIGLGYQTNSQTGSSQPTTNNSFFTNFASKWSQSFGEGSMFDSDGYTFNLGGNAGSFAISPPPPSVMFSENPKDLEDYYMGSLISGGAGATFAAAGIFATAPTFFITQAMTVPGVVQVLTVADALDSTATGVACKLGNEDACSYFAASVAIPGFTSQNMLIDTFDDFAQAWSGVGTTINRNADSIIEAIIPSNYYNNISLGNTETAIDTASDMLFAPNYANQLSINIPETGGALNVNRVVDSLVTDSPGFQTSQVDNIQTWNQSTVVVDNNFHNLPDDIFVNNPNIFIEDNFFPYSVGDQISINPFADISVPMLDTSSLADQADDLLQAMVPTNFSGITTGPNVIEVSGKVPQATEIDINNLPDPEDLPEILGLISPDGVLLPNLRYNITEVDMELPSTKNLTFVTPDGDNLIISVSHGGYGSSIGIKTNIPVKIDGKPFGGGPRTTVSMDKDTSIEIYPGTFLKWDGHGYEPGFTVTTYDSKNFLSVITDNIPTSLRITMFDPRKIRLEQQYKIAIDSMVGFKSGDYNLTDFDQINEAYRLAGLSEETMYRIQSEVDKQWLPDFLPTKETWLSLLHKSNFAEPFLPNSPATVDAIPVFKVTKPADSAKLKAVSESPSLITLNQKVDDPIINSLEQRIDEAAELVSQGRYDEAEKLLLDETFLEEIGIDILTTRAGMSQSDIDQLLDIDDYTFYRIADTFRSPVAGRIEIGEFFDITTKENISFPPFVEKERVSLLIEEFYHRLQDFKEAIINPGYYDTTSMQNGLGGLREMEVSIFLNGHGIPLSDAHLSSYDSRNNIGLPIHNYEVNPPENTIIPTDGFLPFINNVVTPNRIVDVSLSPSTPLATRFENWWAGLTNPKVNTTSGYIPTNGTIEISRLHPHEFGYNPRTVDELTSVLEKGSSLDPVKITEYDGKLYTYDGANRVTAYAQSGQEQVPYIFTKFESLSDLDRLLIETASTGNYGVYNFPERYGTDFPISPLQSTRDTDLIPESWFQQNIYNQDGGFLPVAKDWFNNRFDDIIGRFNGTRQPILTNQEISNITILTPEEEIITPPSLLDNSLDPIKQQFTVTDSTIPQNLPPRKITNTIIRDVIDTSVPRAIKVTTRINPAYSIFGAIALGSTDYVLEEIFNVDLFNFNPDTQPTSLGVKVKNNSLLEDTIVESLTIAELTKNIDALNYNNKNVENINSEQQPKFLFFSQKDQEWQDLPTRNGATIRKSGCGIVTGGMITGLDPEIYYQEYLEYFREQGKDRTLDVGGTSWEDHRAVLESMDYTIIPIAGSAQDIKDQIQEYTDEGIPVWINADFYGIGHHVMATGVNEENNQIILNDPWRGEGFNMQDAYIDMSYEDGDDGWRVYAIIPPEN